MIFEDAENRVAMASKSQVIAKHQGEEDAMTQDLICECRVHENRIGRMGWFI
jgi:hypothetical protein